MINDCNVTDYYNEYCYNNKKETNWEKYYEAMAEKADQEYEDMEEN